MEEPEIGISDKGLNRGLWDTGIERLSYYLYCLPGTTSHHLVSGLCLLSDMN